MKKAILSFLLVVALFGTTLLTPVAAYDNSLAVNECTDECTDVHPVNSEEEVCIWATRWEYYNEYNPGRCDVCGHSGAIVVYKRTCIVIGCNAFQLTSRCTSHLPT